MGGRPPGGRSMTSEQKLGDVTVGVGPGIRLSLFNEYDAGAGSG